MDLAFPSFNIKQTSAYRGIWLEHKLRLNTLLKIQRVAHYLLPISFLIFSSLFLADFFLPDFSVSDFLLKKLLGLSFMLFAYWSTALILNLFWEYLKYPKSQPSTENLAELFDYDTLAALSFAENYSAKKHLKEANSDVLLYGLLLQSPVVKFVFQRALLDQKRFRKSLEHTLAQLQRDAKNAFSFSDDFHDTITASIQKAQSSGKKGVSAEDLLWGLAETNTSFAGLLLQYNFASQDIHNLAYWARTIIETSETKKKIWLPKNLKRHGSLARDWASAYTITLDSFSRELTDEARSRNFPRAIGHNREKEMIERTLTSGLNSHALLVGEKGTGKERLIMDFASRVALGECANELLNYKRVIRVDLPFLLSSLKNLKSVEQTLTVVFQEAANAGNVILVIDELHNFIGEDAKDAPGRVDISGILSSYLRMPNFPVLAITTPSGLHRNLEQNPAFLSYFELIRLSELTEQETLIVLQEMVPSFEYRYKRFVSYPALRAIVEFATKYIQTKPMPKKAMDLLDDSLVYVARTEDNVLLPEHVAAVVTEQTEIPVGELRAQEKETLINLEALIHKRIVGQEEAVKEISSALRRARAEVATRNGPMGSFLFLGPTGVGKTETAKALAAIYFGSEKRMIRLDMSEFQTVNDIPRLLGSSKREGLLTNPVRRNPFSLILLDELEKTHPNILNLFLQILDEGHVTDGLGRKVDFRNTIIIATSNAGFQLILQAIKDGKRFEDLKEEMVEFLLQEAVYRPELLNRFDAVVIYRPLSKNDLKKIAELIDQTLKDNQKSGKIKAEVKKLARGFIFKD
ncbi:MAG: ATP-dependent Clp protease ATP-binding subunit [Candidatus Wildermuthbacteria bacterium]|nr:ATP-dependent Clp protease ATP-binding subunit [Candidatus Wildermuthbacteria bacterium]